MKPFEDRNKKKEKCEQNMNLEDYLTVRANSKGIRTVSWNGQDAFDDTSV